MIIRGMEYYTISRVDKRPKKRIIISTDKAALF